MHKILILFVFIFAALVLNKQASAATYYSDTNGDGYNDTITTNYNNVTIYHPRTQTTSSYSLGSTSCAVNKTIDTDGVAGNEVVIIYTSSIGNGIYVICDRTQTLHQYALPGQFAINSVVDTDGVGGNEVIVLYTNSNTAIGSGIYVICDRTQALRQYPVGNFGTTFTIKGVRDYDGVTGNEICYSWYHDQFYSGFRMITDRTNTSTDVPGC